MVLYARRTHWNQLFLSIVDILVIYGAFRLIDYVQRGDWEFIGYYPLFFVVFAMLWWILARQFTGAIPLERIVSYTEKITGLVWTLLLHAVLLTAGLLIMQARILPIRYLLLLYGVAGVAVVSSRLLLAFIYRTYRNRFAKTQTRFVVVGASRSGRDLQQLLLMHDPLANQCLGFFADTPAADDIEGIRPLVRGSISEVKEFCLREQVDEIYFALPLTQTDLIQELSGFADDNFMSFRIVPDFEGTIRKKVTVDYSGGRPILAVRRHPLGFRPNQLIKRVFDLTFSGVVIFGFFPVIIPVLAILIKLDSPGPVFFTQMRPGRRNKLFPCYKLRTMRTDIGGTELQATKGDARVTRIGRFLRASSLDELPQFFNVWLGHMSVVGPRPNMLSQLEEYSKHISTYAQRHAVNPGITGYAQVNGFRGETRAEGAMEKRVEYDLKYLEDWSLLLDLQIIAKTVWNMVSGEKNAY